MKYLLGLLLLLLTGCENLGEANPYNRDHLFGMIFPESEWVVDMDVDGVPHNFRERLKDTRTELRMLQASHPKDGYCLARVYNIDNQMIGQKLFEISLNEGGRSAVLFPTNNGSETFILSLGKENELRLIMIQNKDKHLFIGILKPK
jgi:hypothetical protein